MSRSRRLLFIGIVAFLALGVSAGWLKYSLGGERSAMEAQRRDLDARMEQLTIGDTPTGDALERVIAGRKRQRTKLDVLESLLVGRISSTFRKVRTTPPTISSNCWWPCAGKREKPPV